MCCKRIDMQQHVHCDLASFNLHLSQQILFLHLSLLHSSAGTDTLSLRGHLNGWLDGRTDRRMLELKNKGRRATGEWWSSPKTKWRQPPRRGATDKCHLRQPSWRARVCMQALMLVLPHILSSSDSHSVHYLLLLCSIAVASLVVVLWLHCSYYSPRLWHLQWCCEQFKTSFFFLAQEETFVFILLYYSKTATWISESKPFSWFNWYVWRWSQEFIQSRKARGWICNFTLFNIKAYNYQDVLFFF